MNNEDDVKGIERPNASVFRLSVTVAKGVEVEGLAVSPLDAVHQLVEMRREWREAGLPSALVGGGVLWADCPSCGETGVRFSWVVDYLYDIEGGHEVEEMRCDACRGF